MAKNSVADTKETQRGASNEIKISFRAAQMYGAMGVFHVRARRERGGGRGRFHFVKRAKLFRPRRWSTVIVTVRGIATKRVFLDFPERVHIVSHACWL